MKQYSIKTRFLSFVLIFLCSGIIACGTIKSENLRQEGFKIANLGEVNSETDRALRFFLESLELEPDNAKALHAAGRLYYLKENYEKAESYLQKAIAIDSKYSDAWNNIGWVYYKKENYEKMRHAFENAIQFRNDWWGYAYDRMGLALAYYLLGDYDRSSDLFYQASRRIKNDSERFQLSLYWIPLAVKLNDTQLAKELWNASPVFGVNVNDENIILKILKGHFADLAGLQAGDRISAIGGKFVKNIKQIRNRLREFRYGESLDISIRRGTNELTQKIVLDYDRYLKKSVSEHTNNTQVLKVTIERQKEQPNLVVAKTEGYAKEQHQIVGDTFKISIPFDKTYDFVLNILKRKSYTFESANKDIGQIVTNLSQINDGMFASSAIKIEIILIKESGNETTIKVAVANWARNKIKMEAWSKYDVNADRSVELANEIKVSLETFTRKSR